jgi:hypothetical protein
VHLGPAGQPERDDGQEGIGPMCHALLGEVQGHDAKESYHRRGGPSAEARQPRVLQKTLELLGRHGRQELGHQEDAHGGAEGAAQTCHPVADKGASQLHGAWPDHPPSL